ncbi:MAG: amidohydrolase family protein [Prosthecobacter sp.]|nr:amidohydrolase family protein [Prosthecobacter sp.]
MKPLPRRTFLQSSLAAAASTLAAPSDSDAAGTAKAAVPPSQFTDVNISLSRWPFRRLPGDDTPEMAARLRKNGVTQAWCGSFDGLLHKDITNANSRLTDDCQKHGPDLLLPVGTINPMLPDWQHDLGCCAEEHHMKAIRLYPNYHGYKLDDPAFLELLAAASNKKLFIQIVAQMEDQRTQHPLVQVAPVDFKPLPAALQKLPEARVMVLNANRAMSMTALQGTSVWLDIAMLEGVGGVENLLKDWPADKVVFGSYAPFFYWEAAKLKLQESRLTPEQFAAVSHGNARLDAA